MRKLDLGQTIAIFANIGVIVGLIFLALEVRHSRTATELQTIADVTGGWITLNNLIASDTETTRVWITGLYRPEALSTVEAAQFSMHLRMFANQVSRVGQHYERGLVAEEDYQLAVAQFTSLIETPGGRKWRRAEPGFDEAWKETMAPYFGQEPAHNLLLGRDPSTIE